MLTAKKTTCKIKLLLVITILLLAQNFSFSQQIQSRDQLIEKAVSKISQDSIKSHIQDLLAFNTRHNLSTKTDNKIGIGAASNYLFSKIS